MEVALNKNPSGPSLREEATLTSELRNANRYGDRASADRLVEQIANVDAGQPAGLTGAGEEMD
ncbi:hypothetical protein AA0488_2412 [Kozakia baliensis NRIC 0488]|uniref:Uncharacterized protein n=1 Tax=Kozakia baliensis TaxID=153496 RepID=A0A1D8USZ3_9PROT|nr:hypothetical protein A0U89_05985 [Kozakia baliensis]GBR31923.1 hypothetical protein AA0488_2412 [Kozakia baliensis NRIC 0488]GEL64698.1 hypothetical protein KBA01_19840 [Kozakia baliensis]